MEPVVTDWVYPQMTINDKPGLSYTGTSPWKLLLHTLEGPFQSAFSAYASGVGHPHVTCDLARPNVAVQHVPFSRASYALRNAPGGTETNRDNVIQVEIAGYSKDTPLRDVEWYRRLAEMIKAIRKAVPGIKLEFPKAGFVGSEGYGLGGAVRMSAAEWDSFSGILGHQHAPENTHWDPGALDTNLLWTLLTAGEDEDMAYIEKYEDPEVGKEWIVSQKRDGTIILREFASPRGDGKKMAGLNYVVKEFTSAGYWKKVK